jgi:hypothetical protein
MSQDERQKISEHQQKFLRLKDQRQVDEVLCQDITRHFAPECGRYPGDDMRPDQLHGKRAEKILDSTPQDALEVAQNGMNSGLTPSSRPWFRLAFRDKGLNKYGPSREWLDKLSGIIYTVLRVSNFYSAIHQVYGEILLFATGCFMKQRDPEHGLRFKTLTYGEYWISCSSLGVVDTLYRSVWMTARQIVQQFGENSASKQVRTDAEKNPYVSYEIIHCVQPRKDRKVGRSDNRNMPFESVWWENQGGSELRSQQTSGAQGEAKILHESGYKTFPYYVPRWKIVGSNMYGTASPAIKKLEDARRLQDMEESMIIAVHKEVDPPVTADTSLQGQPIRTGAGGISYLNQTTGQKHLEPLYNIKFNIQAGEAKQAQLRERIKVGFYNNIFLMMMNIENQADRVTKAQIDQMVSQGLLQLGPFIEHMTDEILDQVIEGVIEEVLEFPEWYGLEPPPKEIQGTSFKIEYNSILAVAQKEVGKSVIDENVNFVGGAEKIFPEAADLIDIDVAIRERADMTGCPAGVIRSEDQVQAIRDRRKQEQEKQEQLAMMQQGAGLAKTLGKTPMDKSKPNALTEMAGAMQGGGGQEEQGAQ